MHGHVVLHTSTMNSIRDCCIGPWILGGYVSGTISHHHDLASPLPHNISLAKPLNKAKSYKKYLESQCSDQWRKHFELTLSNPPGRVRAYVQWHLHNKHKRGMYKPAPYLTHQCCPYQLELLRIRTQHTIQIIPSDLHYAFRHARADYKDRVCPHCLAASITGTKCTLCAIAQPPSCSSHSSLINSKASHVYWTFPPSHPSHKMRSPSTSPH